MTARLSLPPAEQVIVSPSILSADFARLAEGLEQLKNAGADWVHVDVMDGHFVPNLTIGPPVVAALRKATDLPLDVHLMIEKPERYLEAFAKAGADLITVHQEACPHLHRTLQQIRDLGCLAGVSLNPSTCVSTLENVLDDLDLILVMSVNPGFGGQAFIPRSLDKLKKLRTMIEQRPIRLEVDGGVGAGNIADILNAGANTIVAGSAVFNASDMKQMIRTLRGEQVASANTEMPLNACESSQSLC